MIKKIAFIVFITIPITFDILLSFTYFIPFFIEGVSLYDIFTYEVFSLGFFATLVFFLMVGIYTLASLRKKPDPFVKISAPLFSQYAFLILTACVMPLSTLICVLAFMNFSSYLPETLTFDLFPYLFFITKLGIIILLSSSVVFFPQRFIRFGKILSGITLLLLVFGLMILYILFSQEGGPDYHSTFPLDDTKGVYILNFDGDYWVTYYHVSRACTKSKTGNVCKDVYEKVGNAAITASPVDLKPFVDKHVQISGEFVKTQGLLEGKYKKICIKNSCNISTGPGQWVSSPITITTIKIRQK